MKLRRFYKVLLALLGAMIVSAAVGATAFACTPETDDYPPPPPPSAPL